MPKLGVGICRFQTYELTDGHIKILDAVNSANHSILFLGVPKVIGTDINPLDFETRKLMVQSKYPKMIILPLNDKYDDKYWSKQVDSKIHDLFPYIKDVVLYHGRDSFKKNYSGVHRTEEVAETPNCSATSLREKVVAVDSVDFRKGVIYSCKEKHPRIVPCVDMLVYQPSDVGIKFVCGKKQDYSKYMLPGGHFDIYQDSDVIQAGLRELKEETGIDLSNYKYSIKIHNQILIETKLNTTDVRYMTTLLYFSTNDISSLKPKGYDDFISAEIRELNFDHNIEDSLMYDPGHYGMITDFMCSIK